MLNGIPGEFITMARRRGDEWFLGSMTNWNPRQFEISLDFLGEGKYIAEIYMDAPDSDKFPQKCIIRKETVTRNQQFDIKLVSAGGLAVRFKPDVVIN